VLLVPIPRIDLIKSLDSIADTVADGVTGAGDTITYSFVVSNTGDLVLDPIAVSDTKIASVSCLATSLAVGASTTCSGDYIITPADVSAGGVENVATATGTSINPDGSTGTDVTDISDAGTAPDGSTITDPATTETGSPLGVNPNPTTDPTTDPTTVLLAPVPSAVDDIHTYTIGESKDVDVTGNDGTGNPLVPSTIELTLTGMSVDVTLSPDAKMLTVPGEGVWTVNPTTGVVTFTPESGFLGNPTPPSYFGLNSGGVPSNEARIILTAASVQPMEIPTSSIWMLLMLGLILLGLAWRERNRNEYKT
jgi:hypothetical protein